MVSALWASEGCGGGEKLAVDTEAPLPLLCSIYRGFSCKKTIERVERIALGSQRRPTNICRGHCKRRDGAQGVRLGLKEEE